MPFPRLTGRLSTPEPAYDPLTSVHGSTVYDCPTLAAVDGHLAAVGERLARTSTKFPRLRATYRRDLDRLLERRMWLMDCLAVPAMEETR